MSGEIKYPRGSKWRRWDLHVHSPESYFLRGDSKPDWGDFIGALENAPEEVRAIAITDYGTIDGYKKVKEYKENGRLKNIDLILPNVELRIAGPQASTSSNKGIDIHFIFDNAPENHIEEIERCLSELSYETSDSNYSCRKDEFIRLGHELKKGLSDAKARKEGFNNFRPGIGIFREWVEGEVFLQEHCLIATDNSEISKARGYEGNTSSVNEILKIAHMIFSSNANDREHYLGKKGIIPEGGIKPCIHGCDTYELDKLFQVDKDRFCWIKADPTFEGLKQIVIEPEGRVFIGDKPPKLTQAEGNKTKYIDRLTIKKTQSAGSLDAWFAGSEIELNLGLVAIIGNKGSGKSALADILALAGNSHCKGSDYSFLKEGKFFETGLASKFEATIIWLDENSSPAKILDGGCDSQSPEKVKYIPQSHLEEICAKPEEVGFQKELENVLYSRLDETEKGSHKDFKSLMEARIPAHKTRIDAIRRQIKKTNEDIIKLETDDSDENKQRLDAELSEKKSEQTSHKQSKPQQKADKEMEKRGARLDKDKQELTSVNEQITLVSNLIGAINNFKESYDRMKDSTKDDFARIGLKIEDVIKFEVKVTKLDETLLDKKLSELRKRQEELKKSVAEGKEAIGNLAHTQQQINAWNKKNTEIEGEIKDLENQKHYIKYNLESDLRAARDKRSQLTREIISQYLEIIEDQESLYASVKKQIRNNEIIKDKFQFDFVNQITEKEFVGRFLEYLNLSNRGAYHDSDNRDRLKRKMAHVNFGDQGAIVEFLLGIDKSLRKDERDSKGNKVTVASHLRTGKSQQDLYDYIWSLEYLETQFAFTLDGKSIQQLSPGERGTLLLFFYLLMDDNTIPIIIDQPEENLDNQTIKEFLVPIIKEAKKSRQVIMVTHNPNIAVVCDAEQIIHAHIDKSDNYKVTYTPGAIEEPKLNQYLLDVLEGTRPAFDNRGAKYFAK